MENWERAHAEPLHWVQPKSFTRTFELRQGHLVFATLEFRSAFGSLAQARSNAGAWTFKRVGFFSPRVTVRREGEETDWATYRPKWTGAEGVLEFRDGAVCVWKAANFWATQFSFQKSDGSPLVAYRSGTGETKISDVFKSQARVEIALAERASERLPLLILLGWYIMILHQDDSAAIAVVAAG